MAHHSTDDRVRALDEERRTVAHMILRDVRAGANAEQHPLRARLEELVHLGCDARADLHRATR